MNKCKKCTKEFDSKDELKHHALLDHKWDISNTVFFDSTGG